MRIATLAAGLLLVAFGAFATGEQEAADMQGGGGPVSVMVYERGRVVPEEGTIRENRWTEWMAEQVDVEVDWVPVPRWDVMSTLNTLFAAGSAPDVVHDFPRTTLTTLRNQGVLRPVDDIVEEHSEVYKEYLEAHPELRPYVTFEDGQMWALTSKRPIDSIANHTMWIRKDWLDTLGMDMPETEEEFFAALDAFVNEDPDGNGEDDTFAFARLPAYYPIIDALYATFPWYVEDGQATYRIFTPRFESMLRFHKTAYERGWLDPEYISDSNYQRANQQWVTGKAGVAFGSIYAPNYPQLVENNPDVELAPVPPFEHEHGRFHLLDEPPAHRYVMLNRETENVAGAMEFLDWMLADGWEPLTYGFEGEHVEYVDGEIPRRTISNDQYDKVLRYAFQYVLLDQRQVQPEWLPTMWPQDDVSQRWADITTQALEVSMQGDFRRDFPTQPSDEEIGRFMAEFEPIFQEVRTNTIIGGDEHTPEAAVERLRNEWERLGGDEITEIYQQYYEENFAD